MAYSDYGAFVYKNSERRTDKEDVGVYDTEEAEFGSGLRIFANIMKREQEGSWNKPWRGIKHGVMGDGGVRCTCYKQGFPTVWAWPDGAEEPHSFTDEEIIEHNGWTIENPWIAEYTYSEELRGKLFIDPYDCDEVIEFTVPGLDGYSFTHENGGKPRVSTMREPDGTFWTCKYDSCYGAGFEEC